jgi:hypothetical protein
MPRQFPVDEVFWHDRAKQLKKIERNLQIEQTKKEQEQDKNALTIVVCVQLLLQLFHFLVIASERSIVLAFQRQRFFFLTFAQVMYKRVLFVVRYAQLRTNKYHQLSHILAIIHLKCFRLAIQQFYV